jgi:uncharacterized repeat protein (TIGR04076 family)
MYELRVSVTKVMGACTAKPPMRPGDYFTVRDGNIQIPDGGYICLWALQSILPLITPKEREIAEDRGEDWMWRVHHAQCPDPNGRVVFKIERVGRLDRERDLRAVEVAHSTEPMAKEAVVAEAETEATALPDLRVVIEDVQGRCTSGMKPGDDLILRCGRLYIPHGHHFCLYALHAVLPLLPAKQRAHAEDDWLKQDSHVICPDPAGNVVLRIEPVPDDSN